VRGGWYKRVDLNWMGIEIIEFLMKAEAHTRFLRVIILGELLIAVV
jgi:hypothetical protein